jgi:hypothetical protein
MSLLPRPTVEQTIEHYLNELDAAYATADVITPDAMANAAIVALCRAVDNAATPEDVAALSAWATRLRLQGASDADVATMIEVIDHMRQRVA